MGDSQPHKLPRSGLTVAHSLAAAFVLAIHVVVAVILFVVVAAAAVFVNAVIGWCRAQEAPAWALFGMEGIEFFLWLADVWCMLWFVAMEVYKFTVTVWDGRSTR